MKKFVETHRIDENRISVSTENGLDITLFANKDVFIDRSSLQETVGISAIRHTIDSLREDGFLSDNASLHRAVLTPDFHKGSGIPVGTVLDTDGFVIPKCIGRDINCSMRFIATDISASLVRGMGKEFDNRLREIFFEGKRSIAMDSVFREGILRHGLMGIDLERTADMGGLLSQITANDLDHEIKHTHNDGSWETNDLWMFSDYVKGAGGLTYDTAIGSIGGGNHFVELQEIDEVMDSKSAYSWGMKKGNLGIMIHSGSLFAGGMVGDHFMELAKKIYPAHLLRPDHDFYPLPLSGKHAIHSKSFLNALGLASNLAVINRMLMGYMVIKAIKDVTGKDVEHNLVYDLSHNMLFKKENGGYIHRKGASPSEYNMDFPDGHPVIIPGSMGTSSYIMKGTNSNDCLSSAPHGAGRLLSRGKTRGIHRQEKLRIVSKIDYSKIMRKDILDALTTDMMEEAPDAYKPILPAYNTVKDAGMANPVARVKPIMTIKG